MDYLFWLGFTIWMISYMGWFYYTMQQHNKRARYCIYVSIASAVGLNLYVWIPKLIGLF